MEQYATLESVPSYFKMLNKAISIFKRSIKKAELSEIINWMEKYLV